MVKISQDFAPPFKLIAPFFIIGSLFYFFSSLYLFSFDSQKLSFLNPDMIAFVHLFDLSILYRTLSTKACPLHQMILQWVEEAVQKLPNVKSVDVEVVWEPVWNITMAEDHVKKALGT